MTMTAAASPGAMKVVAGVLLLGAWRADARSATVVRPDNDLYLCQPCGATCLPKNYMTDDYSDDQTDESNNIPWGCCYSGGEYRRRRARI